MEDTIRFDPEDLAAAIASGLMDDLKPRLRELMRESLKAIQRTERDTSAARAERAREALADAVRIAKRTLLDSSVRGAYGDRAHIFGALDALDQLAPPSSFRR